MANQEEGNGAESRCSGRIQEPQSFDPNQFMQMFGSLLQNFNNVSNSSQDSKMDKSVELFQKMHPPHFSGTTDPAVADDWLIQMEKLFEGIQCPENRRVALAVLVLEGAADHWWRSQHRLTFEGKPVNEIKWKDFCSVFREWYVPESAREKMRDELSRLRQKEMSVAEYEQKFSALVRYVPEMVPTEGQKCYMFKKGLKDSIRRTIALLSSPTYKELVEAARRLEIEDEAIESRKKMMKRKENTLDYSEPPTKKSSSGNKESSVVPRNNSDTRSFASSPACDICGRRHKGVCWGADFNRVQRCYNCGEEGHMARSCPNAKDMSASQGSSNYQSKGKQKMSEAAASSQGSVAPRSFGRGRGQGSKSGN